MTKNTNLNDRFLCQIEILRLKMFKLFKIPGFSRFFQQNSRFFFQISQIPGFSRFPGKAATLSNVVIFINLLKINLLNTKMKGILITHSFC